MPSGKGRSGSSSSRGSIKARRNSKDGEKEDSKDGPGNPNRGGAASKAKSKRERRKSQLLDIRMISAPIESSFVCVVYLIHG
jgi:hypothetical protein